MRKAVFVFVILLLLLPAVAGCSGGKKEIPVTTDFGKMLASVPASILDEHQVWFQDPGLAKQQAGFGQVNSYAAWQALSADQKKAFMAAVGGAMLTGDSSYLANSDDLYGWDLFMRERTVFCETLPPYQFHISQGTFDAALIKQKFTAQDYKEVSYAGSQYLAWGSDYQIDLGNPFHAHVMAGFNRVMVTNTTIITAPTTAIMQGILDARAGNVQSIGGEPAGRALADQLGEVYGAFIATQSNLTSYFNMMNPVLQFHIDAAKSWQPLHDYALAGIGYRKNGPDRYLDICVAYASAADAEADAPLLDARLKSYVFLTDQPNVDSSQWLPLTDTFDLSAPVVTKYDGAATVTFHLRYLPATGGVNLLTIGSFGDLLFLAPDPAPYLAP